MNQSVLKAVPRAETTKGELNKHRANGQIPAVIYGGGEAATPIFLDEKEFLKVASGISESTILAIELGEKKTRAFVKARQRNSITTKIIHIDFLEVVSGRLLHARVPLHLVGIPVGVREGGVLETCRENSIRNGWLVFLLFLLRFDFFFVISWVILIAPLNWRII